jgi:hypothetical protein
MSAGAATRPHRRLKTPDLWCVPKVDDGKFRLRILWPAPAPTVVTPVAAMGLVIADRKDEETRPRSSVTSLAGQYIEWFTLAAANINSTGNSLTNKITGNAGNNIIDGAAGTDTMEGRAGNNRLQGRISRLQRR